MSEDIISLSSDSDSSRQSSPSRFIDISEVLGPDDSVKNGYLNLNLTCSKVNKSGRENSDQIVATSSPAKCRVVHGLSDSDDSEAEQIAVKVDLSDDKMKQLWEKYGEETENKLLGIGTSDVLLDNANKSRKSLVLQENQTKKQVQSKNNIKISKELRLEEKLRKQTEKEKQKAEKVAIQELQKQMKPGNCMKFVTVVLDSTLVTCTFGGTLIAAIQNSESKYEVSAQVVPYTVSWTREVPGPSVKPENELVLIWQWQCVIPAIKQHTLCEQIQEIQALHPAKTISLVIYGLDGYFSYLKSKRRNGSVDPSKARKRKKSMENHEFPYVTRKDIEEELIELQLMASCNHRLVESAEDLGQLIVQITKAIAETPFKLDRQRREQEQVEWFAVGDSRDCVSVDKAGNGLLRLWQQQLCQFNLAGHDVAQAIAALYPSPVSLVQAYDNCSSPKEAAELLKNVPVRRCQGPLSTSRRVGPELSKKIYTFLCSTNGDLPLSQEQTST